jgi:hypothetical protein
MGMRGSSAPLRCLITMLSSGFPGMKDGPLRPPFWKSENEVTIMPPLRKVGR